MKSWSESINLRTPLRDVCLSDSAPKIHPMDALLGDSWQTGYDKGRIDGEKALSEQLMKQREELQQLAKGALVSIRHAVPQVVRDTENMMVTLALDVARKLVAEIPISSQMIESAIREALTHVESSTQVLVRLNPADLEVLKTACSPVLASAESQENFRFVASDEIGRGGCLLETRFGTVDAQRETKLDLIKKNLLG